MSDELKNERGKRICGSKKYRGGICQSIVLYPNGRCRVHGGTSLAGTDSPNYKHGRHSKYLPLRLAANYEESRKDPNVTDSSAELALVDTRITELLQMLEVGDMANQLLEIRKAWGKFKTSFATSDPTKIGRALTGVEEAVSIDMTDHDQVWQQINQLVDLRRRVVEAQVKRQIAGTQMISREQAMVFVGHILQAVADTVTDVGERRLVAQKIRSLTPREA